MYAYKNNTFILYLFFFSLTVSLYWITRNAGFVTDYLGFQTDFDDNSAWQVINGDRYNIKSFYHFTHICMYAMAAAFRMWGLPWFLLFSGLFALNALLVYRLFEFLFKKCGFEDTKNVILIGVLMFLLSPYQAEVMVWRASFHYLLAFAMMLTILHLALKYMENPLPKYVLYAIILYICSVFSLEFFLFTPFVVLVLLIFLWINAPRSFDFKKTFIRFVGIPLSIIALYFVFYRATHDKWIAHYGVENHVKILSPEAFSTYGKYVVKYLGFARHFMHITKETLFNYFSTPSVSWAILVLILGISAAGLVFLKRMNARNKLIFLNFGLFSILLAPVMTLYFSYVLLTENDRYGYMASAFLFMGISLFLSRLPKWVYYTIALSYLGISSILLTKTNRIWWKSEKVFTNINKTFNWYDADEILVLNAPDNYSGMPMYRTWDESSGIKEAVEAAQRLKIKARMMDVAQYNLTTPTDGAHVRVDSANQIMVIFNQWGNWWWRRGKGANDYENDMYKIEFDYKGCGNCYRMTLKNDNPKRVLLYQVGNQLKEVDMGKIGVEQW